MLFLVTIIVAAKTCIAENNKKDACEKAVATSIAAQPADTVWYGANRYQIPCGTDTGELIRYGYELIANTSYFLGPKGKVLQITNGMNCQNCHLSGGTIPFGNNFGKVYATYPKFRARNNSVQTIYGRINDCLERSLNGKSLDSNTREMQAIYAYIKWLGDGTPRGTERGGTTLMKLPFLNKAADITAGKQS